MNPIGFRILVTGSRDWTDWPKIYSVLEEYAWMGDVTLISGACPTGADKLAENFAQWIGWTIERHPADWSQYKKRAGFVRNDEMVKTGADRCFAFIKNDSRGATMCAELALKANIETRIYRE